MIGENGRHESRDSTHSWIRSAKDGGAALLAVGSLLLTSLAGTGCAELASGGLSEATVVVSGDADESGTAAGATRSFQWTTASTGDPSGASASPESSVAPTAAVGPGQDQPRGDVTATLEVSIQAPDGEWIALTDGLEQASVDIEGETEAELGIETLHVDVYPRIRVRFTDIQARVEAGLPVLGDIGVDFGESSSITVEKQVNLDLGDGDAVDVLVDLNSAEWLNAALPAQKVVAAAHVRNAVEVRVR